MDEVAMICPDVDAGLVKHYASRYFERRGSTILRLYESNADKMLVLSKVLHGGYARFGEDYEPLDLLAPRAQTKTAVASTDAATPPGGALPGTAAGAPAVVLPKLPVPGPLYRRMQTIDFSSIDIGTLGHRIPVELICSLSHNNEPCHGVDIKIVQPQLKHLDPNSPKPDPNDGVIKIVANEKWHKVPFYRTMKQYRPRPTLWMTKDWTLK